MVRPSIALLWFCVVGCGSMAVPPSQVTWPTVAYPFSRTVLQREDVAACADRVLDLGWYGRVEWERAAFLVIADDGGFTCDVWPSKLQFHTAKWAGPIPYGTAAVIHSHPRTLPNPSAADILEAHRLGIPIIVVTPAAVTMVLPGDGQVVSVPYEGTRAARLH